MENEIPANILLILNAVTAKRPRTIIKHIIEHGFITTEEIKQIYGYNHPPRAARDIREQGIPIEIFRMNNAAGRSICAYRFERWEYFRADILKGRLAFPKQFKHDLVNNDGEQCSVCSTKFAARYLQIDHRIPFEIDGDSSPGDRNLSEYMLVCSSCNRAKSWSCEHCINWTINRNVQICKDCYWSSPGEYKHIAMEDIRRLSLVWIGNEADDYDAVMKMADDGNVDMPSFVKSVLRRLITRDDVC